QGKGINNSFNIDIVVVHRAQLEVLAVDDYFPAIDADTNFILFILGNSLVVFDIELDSPYQGNSRQVQDDIRGQIKYICNLFPDLVFLGHNPHLLKKYAPAKRGIREIEVSRKQEKGAVALTALEKHTKDGDW